MLDLFSGALLKDKRRIQLFIFSSNKFFDGNNIFLVIDQNLTKKLNLVKEASLNGLSIFTLESDEELKLGHSYFININNEMKIPLDISEYINFDGFDEEFSYPGDDLGFNYSKKETQFKIRAPLSSSARLVLIDPIFKKEISYKMDRENKGIFSIKIEENLENYLYHFLLITNEKEYRVLDPYGKASNANSKENIVIDFSKTKMEMYEDDLPVYKNYLESIIYELNIRDFTIDENTDIVHKGKYLGLTEENRKTKSGT